MSEVKNLKIEITLSGDCPAKKLVEAIIKGDLTDLIGNTTDLICKKKLECCDKKKVTEEEFLNKDMVESFKWKTVLKFPVRDPNGDRGPCNITVKINGEGTVSGELGICTKCCDEKK